MLAEEGNLIIWEQERFAFPLSFVTLESSQDDGRVQAIKSDWYDLVKLFFIHTALQVWLMKYGDRFKQ